MKDTKFTMHLNIFDGITGMMKTDTDNLSAEMKIFYDKYLLDNTKPNLVHDQFGQKRPIPKNKGKTIEFRRYKTLPKALTALTEGVTPEPNKLSVSTVTATIKQYGDWISLSDMLLLTALDNNLVEAVSMLGDQAGRTLDTVTREVVNAGKNVIWAPKGGTTPVTKTEDLDETATLRVATVMKAAAVLKGANAKPFDKGFVAIIHPFVAYDLMLDPKWEEWNKYTNPDHMYEGEIGRIGNVRFVESTEAKIWEKAAKNKTLSVYSTLVIGKNAYGVTDVEGGGLETIVKQKGSAGTADPLNQRASAGWKATKTAVILSDEFMVRIESCSNFADTKAN